MGGTERTHAPPLAERNPYERDRIATGRGASGQARQAPAVGRPLPHGRQRALLRAGVRLRRARTRPPARLPRRGFGVRAVDFSESALEMGRAYVEAQGLGDRIELGRESLLELSFPDESFDYALCWGVLMHVPDAERAVAELARVLRPGGMLV